MKRVFSSHDRIAVYHARNVLEAGGVRAIVKNEFLSSAMGELPPAECQMEVWVVDESEIYLAEKLLSAPEGPAEPFGWRCACGETAEPQFTHCWHCGKTRP